MNNKIRLFFCKYYIHILRDLKHLSDPYILNDKLQRRDSVIDYQECNLFRNILLYCGENFFLVYDKFDPLFLVYMVLK